MDRNTEIEQYFALWKEPFSVAASHDHWVRRGKLLRVWLPSIDGVPMNVEVTGDFPRALKKWTSLELELRLLFLKGSFYKDEEEYYREEKSHMAAESYIPCGTRFFPWPLRSWMGIKSSRSICALKSASFEFSRLMVSENSVSTKATF